MTRRGYRLTTWEYAATAFSGEGARLYGGRWNSPGTLVVYASESLSLAQLELLVRVQSEDLIRKKYCCVTVEFPEELVLNATALGGLPADWAAPIPRPATQRIGDRWVNQGTSAVLAVPSAVTAGEVNFMFNPAHPDFAKVKVHPAEKFAFDARLCSPAAGGGKPAKQRPTRAG